MSAASGQRRLGVIAAHFDVTRGGEAARDRRSLDTQALQRLLDHDNHELRQRMKDFVKAEIYIP